MTHLRKLLKGTIVQHLGIIFLGAVIFYLDWKVVDNATWVKMLLLCMSVSKAGYFISHNFIRLMEAIRTNAGYDSVMIAIAASIALIIFSFGNDFACLQEVAPRSFAGIHEGYPLSARYFEYLYFSVTTFATVGIGDIYPASLTAKLLVMLEVLLVFAMVVGWPPIFVTSRTLCGGRTTE